MSEAFFSNPIVNSPYEYPSKHWELDQEGQPTQQEVIVEIKGYRQEDAKIKKTTMDSYWIPGVNNHGSYGRWAFAEFTDVWEMQDDFEGEVAGKFNSMLASCAHTTAANSLCETPPNK